MFRRTVLRLCNNRWERLLAVSVFATFVCVWLSRISAAPRTAPLRTVVVQRAGTCRSPRRTGSKDDHDGGWYLCGDQLAVATKRGACVAYSFGIKDNWSFDLELSQVDKCVVHGFDPSPDGLDSKEAYETQRGGGHEERYYHDWGLGGKSKTYGPGQVPFRWPGISYLRAVNTLPWELLTVRDTMERLGNERLDVLKVDTEGAEFFAMKEMLDSGLVGAGNIAQFCVELHFDPSKYEVSGDPSSGGFQVDQIMADDLDILGIMRGLEDQGLRLWKWKFNVEDTHCIEASFVHDKYGI